MIFFFLFVFHLCVAEIAIDGFAKPHGRALESDVRLVTIASAGQVYPSRQQTVLHNEDDTLSDKYVLIGVMDGLGAYIDPKNSSQFVVLVNHEVRSTFGLRARAHGSRGSFVTRLEIDRASLAVRDASDFLNSPQANRACDGSTNHLCAFDRLCSADLPPRSALYNAQTGKGSQERFFFNGEESDANARALAWQVSGFNAGTVWPLHAMGSMRFENAVACRVEQDLTLVAVSDDQPNSGGVMALYVGEKQDSGDELTRAGLTGGRLYAFSLLGFEGKIEPPVSEWLVNATRFGLHLLNDESKINSAVGGPEGFGLPIDGVNTRLRARSVNGTLFRRPEDVAWHPQRPNELLLATSDTLTIRGGEARLWSFVFDDIAQPLLGGTAYPLMRGREGHEMLDNVGFARDGRVLLSEDAESTANHNNRLLEYDAREPSAWRSHNETRERVRMLVDHDPEQFNSRELLNAEFSGMIDVSAILGAGWFLMTSQAHGSTSTVYGEDAQLLAVQVARQERLAAAEMLLYEPTVVAAPQETADSDAQSMTTNVAAFVTATDLNAGDAQQKVMIDFGDGSAPVEATAVGTRPADVDWTALQPDEAFQPFARQQYTAAHEYTTIGNFSVTFSVGGSAPQTETIFSNENETGEPESSGMSGVAKAFLIIFVILFVLAAVAGLLWIARGAPQNH